MNRRQFVSDKLATNVVGSGAETQRNPNCSIVVAVWALVKKPRHERTQTLEFRTAVGAA
jgi:hypothetical protein